MDINSDKIKAFILWATNDWELLQRTLFQDVIDSIFNSNRYKIAGNYYKKAKYPIKACRIFSF